MFRPLPCLIAMCALVWISARLAADELDGGAASGKRAEKTDTAALFDSLDRDGDGQLTRDEVPEGKQALFDRLVRTSDKDGNGSLSRSEFASGLESKRAERALTEKLPDNNPGGPLARDPEKMFARLDANSDGKIVADEVPDQLRGMFDQMLARADKDADGALTKQELMEAIELLKPPVPGNLAEMDPAKIFDYLDKNADGKISADEIPEGRPMLQQLMKRGDKDGDGTLSQDEFTTTLNAFRKMQGGQSPQNGQDKKEPGAATQQTLPNAGGRRIVDRISKMDADHDGKISRDEFAGPEKKRFSRIDTNGDGYLEKQEIERFAAGVSEKMKSAGGGLRKAAARMAPKDDAKPSRNSEKSDSQKEAPGAD